MPSTIAKNWMLRHPKGDAGKGYDTHCNRHLAYLKERKIRVAHHIEVGHITGFLERCRITTASISAATTAISMMYVTGINAAPITEEPVIQDMRSWKRKSSPRAERTHEDHLPVLQALADQFAAGPTSASDAQVRKMMVICGRLDFAARNADMTKLPVMDWETQPANASLVEAEVITIFILRPKENYLRPVYKAWSDPIEMHQDPTDTRPLYRLTLWSTWMTEFLRRTKVTTTHKLHEHFGRQIFHPCSYMRLRRSNNTLLIVDVDKLKYPNEERDMSSDTCSKYVSNLYKTHGIKLDSQHLRGQVATYWWHLGVLRGKYSAKFVSSILRHRDISTTEERYVTSVINPDVLARFEDLGDSAKELTLTQIVRV